MAANKADVNKDLERERESDSSFSESSMTDISQSLISTSTPSRTKRKASPLYKIAAKKSASTLKCKGNMSFAEMLSFTFRDPAFLESVAPIFHSLVEPTVERAIYRSAQTAAAKVKTDVLEEVIKSNEKLQKTLTSHMQIINLQRDEIDQQARTIDENTRTISKLEQKVEDLTIEVNSIKTASNELEQYGRHNSLRFSNLDVDVKLPEPEITKHVVGFINKHMLREEYPLTVADVDRCHPIGRPRPNGQSQILIKFNQYKLKHLVYGSKAKLKSNPSRVFVSEDLTKTNYSIIKELHVQPLRKSGKIVSFCTSNENVLAKQSENSRPVRIHHVDSINPLLLANRK